MDTFKPVILNSKMADKHYINILSEHDKLKTAMQNQSFKVQQYQQEQKQSENERQQLKMTNDRDMLEQENKAKELAIKAQALTM